MIMSAGGGLCLCVSFILIFFSCEIQKSGLASHFPPRMSTLQATSNLRLHINTLYITVWFQHEDYAPFMSAPLGNGGVDENNASMLRFIIFFFLSSSSSSSSRQCGKKKKIGSYDDQCCC
jgi:hypothetical protein